MDSATAPSEGRAAMTLVLWVIAVELLVLIAIGVACLRDLGLLLESTIFINKNVVDLQRGSDEQA